MGAGELARRLAVHPRFEWHEGMAAIARDGGKWRVFRGDCGFLRGQGEPNGYVGGWVLTAPILGAAPDLSDRATAGALVADLIAAARTKFLVVEIENDWRTKHPEIRLVELHGGGRFVRVAFVEMSLGEAAASALLAVWG